MTGNDDVHAAQRLQRRGLLWLSAESAAVHLGAIDIPPPERGDPRLSDADIAEGTLWQLTTPGAGGAPQVQVIARSHPHGHWMAWYGVQQRPQG